MSNEASITVNQVDVKSFAGALWNPQEYEIYIDDRKVGLLNGYQNQAICPISPGLHTVYVRAYARNSVTVTRVYGLSQTLEINISAGENKRFSCGRVKGPPLRKPLVLTSAVITFLLFLGLGPVRDIPVRIRYVCTMGMALVTMACTWIGHSSTPGTSIYLKEI